MATKTPKDSNPSQTEAVDFTSPDTIKLLKKSKDAQALVSWIKDGYKKAKSNRQQFERQWYLNYAFYKGRQNVVYLPSSGGTLPGGLITPKVPPYRVRSITNRIKPIIRTEISKLTSNKPSASIIPASNEDKDLFAAQAGEQIWESTYANKNLHRIFSQAAFWTSITGNGFIKTWWDSGAVATVGDQKYQGDLCYSSVTPFNIFVPDLSLVDLEEQPYVLNAYTKSPEWVKQTYGPHVVVNPNCVAATEIIGEGFFRTQSGTQRPDSVLVIEAWIKPKAHPMFPQGGMVTIVDETIVQLVENFPYTHGMYPFSHIQHIPTGEFYADSVINDLVAPQREYNRTRSQIIESKQRMAKPQLMAPIGSVDAKKITTEPGQLIEYRPGLDPPHPLPLQPLPSYVLQELDIIRSDMEDISSQHEVTRGEAPAGVTAATAINYLQEKDDGQMATAFQSVEQCWEKVGKETLSLIVQYWDTPRIVNITGVDGAFDAITLKGSEIASGTDIRVEAGSALPTSKSARQAFLLDLMTKGMIDPNEGLALLDMGGLKRLEDKLKLDERQAQRENLRLSAFKTDIQSIYEHMQAFNNAKFQAQELMAQQQQVQGQQQMASQNMLSQIAPDSPPETADAQQQMQFNGLADQMNQQAAPPTPLDIGFGSDPATGAPLLPSQSIVPVNSWDNHAVHIQVHNDYRKTQDFELLPDPVKQQFELHVQAHAMALNQSAMAAQAMPPDMGGAPGGPPGQPQGSNQFGPPGSSQGAPPPQMMGQ